MTPAVDTGAVDTGTLDDLKALYQETILEHSKRPRNFGKPAGATVQARGYNPLCGDQVTLWLALDEQRHIHAAGFEGKGCALCLASASLMTEAVADRDEAEARALAEGLRRLCSEQDYRPPAALEPLLALSGVRNYPARVKCATLPWHTLVAALDGKGEATSE